MGCDDGLPRLAQAHVIGQQRTAQAEQVPHTDHLVVAQSAAHRGAGQQRLVHRKTLHWRAHRRQETAAHVGIVRPVTTARWRGSKHLDRNRRLRWRDQVLQLNWRFMDEHKNVVETDIVSQHLQDVVLGRHDFPCRRVLVESAGEPAHGSAEQDIVDRRAGEAAAGKRQQLHVEQRGEEVRHRVSPGRHRLVARIVE